MANITRFDPYGDFLSLVPFRDFDDLLRMAQMRSSGRNLPAEKDIRMDVSEDDKAYHVKAEVPGVKKEDIHVAVENNQVSITTEFKKETEEKKGETVLRSERYCGMQSRSFTLMHDVDQSKAEARYQDGILELTLPKKSNGGALKQLKVQ